MSGRHGLTEGLYRDGTSPLHRLPAQCKVAATVLFVLAVVSTPREAFWAYGLYAGAVVALAAVARIPPAVLARRLLIEAPFVGFALLLPLIGQGERVDVLGVSLSTAGLWGAWNILVKGTLGVAASVVLAATTPMADLIGGLGRLGMPKVVVSICAFMVRYADVVTGELHRMRIARESRGHDPRWIWQARAVASTAGALFVRSYERGERVYVSMLSRGYTGAMPLDDRAGASVGQWAVALLLPAGAAAVSVAAWTW